MLAQQVVGVSVLGSRVLHDDGWKAVQGIEQKVGIDQIVKDQHTQGKGGINAKT